MLTKLILVSPDDYQRMKDNCSENNLKSSSNNKNKEEKMTRSEILREWMLIKDKAIRESTQNRKRFREKDVTTVSNNKKSFASTQTSPKKKSESPSPNKIDNSDTITTLDFTTADEDDEVDEQDQSPKTPPTHVIRELYNFFVGDEKKSEKTPSGQTEKKTSTQSEKKSEKRKSIIQLEKPSNSSFGENQTLKMDASSSESIKKPARRRRKASELYSEDPDRMQTLRVKRFDPFLKFQQKGGSNYNNNFKFIKQWESI